MLRRTIVPTLVAFFVSAAVFAGGAEPQTAGQTAGGTATTEQAAQTPAQALTAASRITDPEARLAALEKIRTDFASAPQLTQVDQQIFTTLVNSFPDRVAAITPVLDRILARIPETATADLRLNQTLTPVTMLIGKKIMLDRSETLLTASLDALDLTKYAESRREAAKRINQPEPTQQVIETTFNSLRARGLEQLGRLYLAKGDTDKGVAKLQEAIKAAPSVATAVTALSEHYTAKGEAGKAEDVLKDALKAAPTSTPVALALVDIYTKRGDSGKAEEVLKDTLKAVPTFTRATVMLAGLEAKRGDDKAALDHYIEAAVAGAVRGADDVAMRALYKKVRGSDAGLEGELNKIYRDKFPNPVTPEHYKATAARTDKVVLLEMFTGSGCPPCVSADLAMEAVMERYPSDAIIAVAYHANIPQPDPMTTSGSDGRREYYKVSGVPTFNIDGALGQLGGGARANTPGTYNSYIKKIDAALETPSKAALSVKATGEGEQVSVTVDVTKLPADAKDLRLHVLLVEKELTFAGENGIRFHPVTVRAVAGDRGAGIPITATGKFQHSFNLAAVRDDVTKTLTAEMARRRSTEAPGSTPREYAADGRPYTAIDPNALSVVAFIQQGPYTPPPPATPPAATTATTGGTTPPQTSLQQATQQIANQRSEAAGTAPPAPAPNANVLQAAKTDVVFAGGGRKN
jgi:tetratricopeptide (TPR) repeat protein